MNAQDILEKYREYFDTEVFEDYELTHIIQAIKAEYAQLPAKLSDEEVRRILNKHCSKFRQREKTLEMCFYDAIHEALSIVQGGREDTELLDGLEALNTLHQQVEILYVVDGYEVKVICDRTGNEQVYRADTLRHAIRSAMRKSV